MRKKTPGTKAAAGQIATGFVSTANPNSSPAAKNHRCRLDPMPWSSATNAAVAGSSISVSGSPFLMPGTIAWLAAKTASETSPPRGGNSNRPAR